MIRKIKNTDIERIGPAVYYGIKRFTFCAANKGGATVIAQQWRKGSEQWEVYTSHYTGSITTRGRGTYPRIDFYAVGLTLKEAKALAVATLERCSGVEPGGKLIFTQQEAEREKHEENK